MKFEMIEKLKEYNIGIGVHYLSIPEHPYYQNTFGWKPEETPIATKIGRNILSIPFSPKLSNEDVSYVINSLNDIFLNEI